MTSRMRMISKNKFLVAIELQTIETPSRYGNSRLRDKSKQITRSEYFIFLNNHNAHNEAKRTNKDFILREVTRYH